MKKRIVLGLFSLCLVLLTQCYASTADIEPVRNFNILKYSGKWYEIARLDHFFERDMDYVYTRYGLTNEFRVTVENVGVRNGEEKSIKGIAYFVGSDNLGDLKVSLNNSPFVQYKVIFVDSTYEHAVVTSSTRGYLWILARKPHIEPAMMKRILTFVKDSGFDVDKLIYPKQ